ncbi:hypothetical protein [Brevibacillus laterosporus]|uniref:hypothetical protein n=1 Tax=Brevibacillus laterosporus TaxID=1465 RepID=UPI002800710D|nr:hypothetical protein [Brevibacillus laterosporus]
MSKPWTAAFAMYDRKIAYFRGNELLSLVTQNKGKGSRNAFFKAGQTKAEVIIVEKSMNVNGREFHFATTYDGDSQYDVQVHSGKKIVSSFKIYAESEQDVFPAALAHMESDIEMGNLQL